MRQQLVDETAKSNEANYALLQAKEDWMNEVQQLQKRIGTLTAT